MSVGFRWQGQDYTAETPCRFEQCLIGDWENWAARANQYLMVLEERVRGDAARQAVVNQLRNLLGVFYMKECSRFAAAWPPYQEVCQDGVKGFIGLAQAAEAAAKGWGEPITVGDGESFTLAYDWGGIRPHLPRPGGDFPPVVPPGETHPHPGLIPGVDSIFDLFGKMGAALPVIMLLFLFLNVAGGSEKR
jgi:hypothetical protein